MHTSPNNNLTLGWNGSYNILTDPKHLGFVLARYRFAARMVCGDKHVLELGCNEGAGVATLMSAAKSYTGVDSDQEAIAAARRNWERDQVRFIVQDFLEQDIGSFDGIVSLDVVEHIDPREERRFWKTIFTNLHPHGACVIGTPNVTSSAYASTASQKGHVNLFDAARLAQAMQKIFYQVLLFGMNDEIVHTGFPAMCHYLLAVGCFKREGLCE